MQALGYLAAQFLKTGPGLHDLLAIHAKDGIEGVITGRALYDGRLDLARALKVAKGGWS